MPTTVTESDAYPTSISVFNDTEAANQASVLSTFLQGLTNRTNFLWRRQAAGPGIWLYLPPAYDYEAEWQPSTTIGSFITNLADADEHTIRWAVPHQVGARIVAVKARVIAAAGH